jgi:integrase
MSDIDALGDFLAGAHIDDAVSALRPDYRAVLVAVDGRSIPVPQRLVPILTNRVSGRSQGAPAITSPAGALLGLENWKRSTGWRAAIVEIGRPKMRVHDLRHTYASLARRAGADLPLLQKTMGHASITATAHVYADLYDDELDVVASALDALDDRPSE